MAPSNPENPRYQFEYRWKEVLVCTAAEGSFGLEMTMGKVGVYLPTEEIWKLRAPGWAKQDWAVLFDDLKAWCSDQNVPLHIDETAVVY